VSPGPSEESMSEASASASAMVSSLVSLKASPALVAAFLRTQPGMQAACRPAPLCTSHITASVYTPIPATGACQSLLVPAWMLLHELDAEQMLAAEANHVHASRRYTAGNHAEGSISAQVATCQHQMPE